MAELREKPSTPRNPAPSPKAKPMTIEQKIEQCYRGIAINNRHGCWQDLPERAHHIRRGKMWERKSERLEMKQERMERRRKG